MKDWTRIELDLFLKSNSSGLLYFYTPLCGTCQIASKMLQVIRELVNINMGKMNVNYVPEVAKAFAVESVPSLLFIQDGVVVEKIYAFHSVPYLLEKVNKRLR